MNLNNPQTAEKMEFVEKRLAFYTESIKGYLEIKSLHYQLVNSITEKINLYLTSVSYCKKSGTKQQLQTLKENLNWYKTQLKAEKSSLKWCNERIKHNKESLKYWGTILKELTKQTTV